MKVMKGYLYLAAIYCLFPLLASAQSDVYYIPSKKAKTVTKINSNGGGQRNQDSEILQREP